MSRTLSSEHIEALHNVDVQLGFITHGDYASYFKEGVDPANGPVVLGVHDADYAVPAQLLEKMQPGDVFSQESAFGTPVLSNRDLVDFIAQTARRTPYIPNPFEANEEEYHDAFQSLTAGTDPGAIAALPALTTPMSQALESGRALQTLAPFEYTSGLAAIKGIGRAIADSPPEVFESGRARNVKIRDADMARGLGDIAVSMLDEVGLSAGRKQILAHTAGDRHSGLRRILQSNGIPVTSHSARAPFRYAVRREWASAMARPASIDRPDQVTILAIHEWFRNLRTHGYEPRNTTIKLP